MTCKVSYDFNLRAKVVMLNNMMCCCLEKSCSFVQFPFGYVSVSPVLRKHHSKNFQNLESKDVIADSLGERTLDGMDGALALFASLSVFVPHRRLQSGEAKWQASVDLAKLKMAQKIEDIRHPTSDFLQLSYTRNILLRKHARLQ